MATDFGIFSQPHFGTPAEMGKMANYRWDPLDCDTVHRLPMADVAGQLPALGHGVLLLLALEGRRAVGTDQWGPGEAGAPESGTE